MADAIEIVENLCFSHRENGAGLWPQRIAFCYNGAPPPRGCFQVPFPRLEIVVDGTYRNRLCDNSANIYEYELVAGDALFIPADCWNMPAWDNDAQVLSLLFGVKHLGVSFVAWDLARREFSSVDKCSCMVPGNSPLYQMVNALSCLQPERDTDTYHARLLVSALLEYTRELLEHPLQNDERQSSALYRSVCSFIEQNFDKMISRDIVAREFRVSPNYLSRVFNNHGDTTFSHFLTSVRIGRAKEMLEESGLSLIEVSQRCGFHDPNYFFKVFKKRVKRTPTEYRSSLQASGQERVSPSKNTECHQSR